MGSNPLRDLNKLGQSVWQDYIRRSELLNGDLKRLIDEDGISGVTSNPTIFEKAIAAGSDYDTDISRFVEQGLSGQALFEPLSVWDIQNACDLFRATYDAAQGRDGYVSIEVTPDLARDTQGTVEQARRLWKSVNRPNVLVKIPGTKEGLPAIKQCLSEGININITLLFSQERYVEVVNTYLAALEQRVSEGKPVDRLFSVASFFVNRIDTIVDNLLEKKIRETEDQQQKERLRALLGKVAIANAKMVYQKFKLIFFGARFERLRQKSAGEQKVLWASTSTKNPNYPDTLYVDHLVGANTINTMPPATIKAFREHGVARMSLEENIEGARRVMHELEESGIELDDVTAQAEDQGVELFTRDYQKLLEGLEEKRKKIETQRKSEPLVTEAAI
jgi:transaldolase